MDIHKINNSIIRSTLDFLFPPLCLGCGVYTEEEYDICLKCRLKLDPFDQLFCLNCFSFQGDKTECPQCCDNSFPLLSYAPYAAPLKDIIIQYKFKGITKTAKLFAKLLDAQFHEQLVLLQADYLIPIPLYKMREKQRGYNQAALFAESLSEHIEIPVTEDIIFRDKKGKPQARLAYSDREKNIKSVFSIEEKANTDVSCIIVDDVVTSGNTVKEAARTLENNGYKVKAVISIAHAL